MSSLKIYLQDVPFKDEGREDISDFKKYLSQSDFHIGCIMNSYSYISQMRSVEEVVDADIFDVFGKREENMRGRYFVRGPIIVVRKHLSAYIHREWMTEGERCVWVTVPSQGGHSRLHVTCVDFLISPYINFFTQILTSLIKTHANDKFLVVGRVFTDDWISKEHQQIETPRSKQEDGTNRFRNSVSRAGLVQFNNINNNAVLSSVPVNVMHCPRPFVLEEESCQKALEFSLNIGPSKCCKTATNTIGGNCTNEPSGQHEVRQEDVSASRDSSIIIDRLVHKKWDDVTKLLPELISEKFEQTTKELKAVQEECGRMSKENESAKSACERKIEKRLQTLEERALAHQERSGFVSTGTQTTFGKPAGKEEFGAAAVFGSTLSGNTPQLIEHCAESGVGLFGASLSHQDFGQSNTGVLFDQLRTSKQTGFGDKTVDGDMDASAIISKADTTLTTSPSQIIRKQIQNETESQNVETLCIKGTAGVTPTTLSKPAAKAALQKLLASATAFRFYSNLKATLVSDSSFNPDAITMPLILFDLVFKQVIVPELL